MARRLPRDPQQIQWRSDQDRADFLLFLTEQLQLADDARAAHTGHGGLIDRWHELYEQAPRRRGGVYADGADLASYIPTEKVDSMRARLVQIVFGPDPICTVEGWGEPSEKVAKVEAFHQWQAENERLQPWLSKAIHNSLIEGTGILEVSERVALKKTRTPFKAAAKLDEWFRPVLDDQMRLTPDTDESGHLKPWSGDPAEPMLDVTRESIAHTGQGPEYRILSLRDFRFLPQHARDVSEVWGYAKRFHLRKSGLEHRVQSGLYSAEAVEALLGHTGDREARPEHQRQGVTIAAQDERTAEYELWQVSLFYDVDGDGIDEWLIATVSLKHQVLLRAAYDNLEQPRFVALTPFPRPDSVYGYSFVGHKLWTIAEEHTATRNMKADRQAMALNAPITRLTTAIWDPDDQPFGVGAVIDVRSHEDIRQMVIADVPASTIESERTTLAAAERLSGLNDTATSGVTPEARRTATEIATVSQASYVRVEEAVRNMQESLEDLYLLRHELWKRALAASESGVHPPSRITQTLELRGINIPSEGPFAFTAADLEGHFRFKPRGSVETADKYRLRSDFGEFINGPLAALAQMFPQQWQMIQANPAAAQELFEYALRLWGIPNLQPFLQAQPGMAAPQGVGPMAGAMGGPAPDAGMAGLLAQLPPELAAMMGGGGQPGGGMLPGTGTIQ